MIQLLMHDTPRVERTYKTYATTRTRTIRIRVRVRVHVCICVCLFSLLDDVLSAPFVPALILCCFCADRLINVGRGGVSKRRASKSAPHCPHTHTHCISYRYRTALRLLPAPAFSPLAVNYAVGRLARPTRTEGSRKQGHGFKAGSRDPVTGTAEVARTYHEMEMLDASRTPYVSMTQYRWTRCVVSSLEVLRPEADVP